MKILDISESLLSSESTEGEITQAAEVLNNSISLSDSPDSGLQIIDSIKKTTDSLTSLVLVEN